MGRRVRKPEPVRGTPLREEEDRVLREALEDLQRMSVEELFALAVRAGIYTKDGQLTPPYRDDAPPSACRPTK
jgi:hypothetical protein